IMANAPDGYHGYWIEDFFEVDEQFGTMDSLRELVEEAHERDMKVIVELVTNYAAKSNPIVTDSDKQGWIDQEKNKPVDDYPWLENVVSLDQSNPDVEKYLMDVAEFWLDESGIDGYNLHAAEQSSPELVENKDLFEAMTEVFANENVPVSKLYEAWEESENPSGLLYVDDQYTKRFTQLFAEQGRNKVTVWKLALTYMYTAPGVPLIYQG